MRRCCVDEKIHRDCRARVQRDDRSVLRAFAEKISSAGSPAHAPEMSADRKVQTAAVKSKSEFLQSISDLIV
jgi:hypothetical protein